MISPRAYVHGNTVYYRRNRLHPRAYQSTDRTLGKVPLEFRLVCAFISNTLRFRPTILARPTCIAFMNMVRHAKQSPTFVRAFHFPLSFVHRIQDRVAFVRCHF